MTGLLLLVMLGAALACGGWVLLGFLLLISTMALWEFYALFWKGHEHLAGRILAVLLGAGFLVVTWRFPQFGDRALLAAVPLLLTVFLFLWGTGHDVHFTDTALLIAGLCYVPLLLTPVFTFSMHEQLFLVGTTIISDTVAYFVGIRIGRHKIWPSVSPKKSVEGSMAGLAGSIAWAVLLGMSWGAAPVWQFVVAGIVLGVASQLGDFFESAIKRICNVKDSGSLLPGHGGMLDRIDSLLFVVPVYVFFCLFLRLFG